MPREVLVKWLETLSERLRLARRITAVVGLVLLLYFFGTWLWCYVFYVRERVVLRENQVAKLREPYLAHAAESRVWDAIQPLSLDRERWALPEGSSLHNALMYGPGTEGWDEVAVWLGDRKDVTAQLREASKRPVMGYDFPSAEENPVAMLVHREHLGASRQIARLLRGDAHLAASEGDWERFAANVDAMCKFAKLVADVDGMVDVLVGHAIYMSAAITAGDHLANVPTEQLASLRQSLSIKFRDDPAYAVRALDDDGRDMLQRIFSDTGNGRGGICRDGINYLRSVDTSGKISRVAWAAPRLRMRVNRMDAAAINSKVLSQMNAWVQLPAWERTMPAVKLGKEDEFASAFAPISNMWGATTMAIASTERTRDMQFAALLAMDAEIIKRQTGAYPDVAALLAQPDSRRDRFTGEQLLTSVASGQLVIYARGPDTDDDGGTKHQYFKWNADSGYDTTLDGDEVLWPPAR
ncbi:MAG: hypothetical protein ACK5ZG_00285 [Phycisphaerae bacterium]|jgi:hypothetical protein